MFSLEPRARPVPSPIAASEFSAARSVATARMLIDQYGARQSGTQAGARSADFVAEQLAGNGFAPRTDRFEGRVGRKREGLVNVVAQRVGTSDRKIVVVAPRDGLPGEYRQVGAAETGTLIEVARVLDGRNLRHTVVLVSADGSLQGGLGAARYASVASGPVDAVLVLRNAAVGRASSRSVITGLNSAQAPDQLVLRTAQQAMRQETNRTVSGEPVFGQLVRLAFPLALGDQAHFSDRKRFSAAAAMSPGGEAIASAAVPAPGEPAPQALGEAGRAIFRVLTALDGTGARSDRSPRVALVARDQILPGWALNLLVGMLLLPLMVAGVDSFARARRFGHRPGPAFLWPIAFAVPLILCGLVARGLGAAGLTSSASAGVPDPVSFNIGLEGGVLLAILGALVVLGWIVILIFVPEAGREQREGASSIALSIAVLTGLSWVLNPLTAAFFVIPAHVLVLMLLSEARPPRGAALGLLTLAVVPVAAATGYYLSRFELGPVEGIWLGQLMVGGGAVSAVWLVLGCALVGSYLAATIQVLRPQPTSDASAPRATRSVLSTGRDGGRSFG